MSCGTFDLVYVAIHPEFLFPTPIVLLGGLFKDTVVPDFVTRSVAVLIVTTLACIVGSILAMVVFRYVKCT